MDCYICGKKVKVEQKRGISVCSLQCWNKALFDMIPLLDHEKALQPKCQVCGKPATLSKGVRRRFYCSIDCYKKEQEPLEKFREDFLEKMLAKTNDRSVEMSLF